MPNAVQTGQLEDDFSKGGISLPCVPTNKSDIEDSP